MAAQCAAVIRCNKLVNVVNTEVCSVRMHCGTIRRCCCAGERTQSYTLGKIGDQRVVTMKLPLLHANAEATSTHGDVVANFLG